MKHFLLFIFTIALLAFPKVNFGQAPNLGSTSSFAVFTAAGAFNNDGASVITGDIGSFTSLPVGFPIPGTVVGNIYNVGSPALTSAKADVGTAFGNFSAAGSVMGTPLETYNTTGFIYAGTYHTVGAAVLNGDFTLDAQGDPNALFVININGALTVGAGLKILLINSASICNVYWQINGDFTLGAGSVFKGTVLSNGAITLLEASSLMGRALTSAGAIALHNNVITVNSLPAAAGTINGTAAVCREQKGLIYSVPTISNAASYLWTLPAGASIVAGVNTNRITVDFSASAVSGPITVQGSNACANGTVSANFALTVNPTPAAVAGANRAFCSPASTQIGATAVSGSSYSWSSAPAGFSSTVANPTVTPLVTTTYTVVESNPAFSCTGSHSVIVTVNALPAAIAGINRAICLTSSTQIGATAVSGSTYSWSSVPAGFTSTVANPTVTPLVTTTYTVVESNPASGCTGTHSVLVTVNLIPAAQAGDDRNICANTSTQIGAAAVAGSTYRWSSAPAGFTSTIANPTVSPLLTTTYTLVETITASGCTNSTSVEVRVNPATAAQAGADRAICLNSSTQIGAPAVSGSTYSWTSVPAGFTSTVANPTVSPLVATTYTLVETNTAITCSNSNSVKVSINALPLAIAGAARTICFNENTTLGATAITGSTYSWTSVPAGYTSTEANPTVSPKFTTTYTLVETNTAAGCTNSHLVVVTVNPAPAAQAGADRAICFNENTTLGASAIAGSTYSWTSVPAGFTSSLANPSVKPIATTTYTVVETSAAGCINTHSVVVTLLPAPAALAGADRNICLKESTQIGATAVTGSSYQWSSAPAGFTSTLANPSVSPLVTTTYTVVETNVAKGCQGTNSVTVTLNKVPTIVTEPADQTTCVGSSASFSVTATGPGLTYQWRKGTVALNNGGNISGATSATLTLNSVKAKDAGSDYNVVITGACATVETSNNVSLEVNAAPSISTSACVGSSASFSATATGEGLTYQWRKGTVNLTDGGNITGSNSPTLTINPVSATDASSNYNVLITGTCSTEGASLNIGLIVNTAMNITAQPTNQVACVGTAAIFTVGATGTGLSYQWKKGSVNLINGGTISGATSATLVINPVSAADVASDYHVVITGPCSSMATSTPASLSLCIPTGTSSLKAGDLNNVVTIYPNPFTSSIDVKVADASKMDNYELRIFSITGDVVLKTRLVKEITTLETSHLAPGVYSYQVNSNSKTIQSGKLISKQ